MSVWLRPICLQCLSLFAWSVGGITLESQVFSQSDSLSLLQKRPCNHTYVDDGMNTIGFSVYNLKGIQIGPINIGEGIAVHMGVFFIPGSHNPCVHDIGENPMNRTGWARCGSDCGSLVCDIPQHTGAGIDFNGRSFELTFDYGDQTYKKDNFAAFHYTNVGEGQKNSGTWHNTPNRIYWARGHVTQEEFLRSAKAVGSKFLSDKGYELGYNDCQHFTVNVLKKVGAPYLVQEAEREMNGFGLRVLQWKVCFLGLDLLEGFSEGIKKLCGDGISDVTESCNAEVTNYEVGHDTVTQKAASCSL